MSRNSAVVLAVVIGCALLVFPNAQATVIHVPSEQLTIQDAVSAAGNGDTILVAAGTYLENVVVESTSLTLLSESGSGLTTIEAADADSSVIRIFGGPADTVTISGLTITGVDINIRIAVESHGATLVSQGNVFVDNREGAIYVTSGGSVVVDSSLFMHNQSAGRAPGIVCVGFGTASISRSIFYDNVGGDFFDDGGAGITLIDGNEGTVRDCYFNQNQSDRYGAGVNALNVAAVNVFDNTFDANTGQRSGAVVNLVDADSIGFFNNIVTNTLGNGSSTIFLDDATIQAFNDYNDAWGNMRVDFEGVAPGVNTLYEDPLYVGPLPVYFDLQLASPCINTGYPDPAINDPDGSRSDMGARRLWEDFDLDGISDDMDNCPVTANPLQEDADLDGIGDVCDNCPSDANSDQADSNGNGIGDVCDLCDEDRDADAVCDGVDNCPDIYNPDQADSDSNGVGDACELLCDCPYPGDLDANGQYDLGDLNDAIAVYFYNAIDIQDPKCPIARADVSGDGQSDAVDLSLLIQTLFFNGLKPCNPCDVGGDHLCPYWLPLVN